MGFVMNLNHLYASRNVNDWRARHRSYIFSKYMRGI